MVDPYIKLFSEKGYMKFGEFQGRIEIISLFIVLTGDTVAAVAFGG